MTENEQGRGKEGRKEKSSGLRTGDPSRPGTGLTEDEGPREAGKGEEV